MHTLALLPNRINLRFPFTLLNQPHLPPLPRPRNSQPLRLPPLLIAPNIITLRQVQNLINKTVIIYLAAFVVPACPFGEDAIYVG